MTRYNRVLLKLSGGALSGASDFGFAPDRLEHIAHELLGLTELGVQVGVVIGGRQQPNAARSAHRQDRKRSASDDLNPHTCGC